MPAPLELDELSSLETPRLTLKVGGPTLAEQYVSISNFPTLAIAWAVLATG